MTNQSPRVPLEKIRNFSIIAHIDHGKSTLSDRFIQYCGGLSDREMLSQVLDSMDLERERGITIKAQSVTLFYTDRDGEVYQLNFIDTPGHVDFSYEVSRSLAACEGALLVVDAGQGVEAQTVANCYTAVDMGLVVLPVLNKIDLPAADPLRVAQEIEEIIGLDTSNLLECSAKLGRGIDLLLEQIVAQIPPPKGDPNAPLQALVIDSWFDNYLGVVSLVRVMNGVLQAKLRIRVMSTGVDYVVNELGIFTPKKKTRESLYPGEVGWVVCGVKEIFGVPVGDTLTSVVQPSPIPLPGFKKIKPQVYAALFPVDGEDYDAFRDALNKLSLNDAALSYQPETSAALGFGFRCGFLGLLHMEIVQERLEREHQLDLLTTAPTVVYEVLLHTGELSYIDSPSKLPPANCIQEIREPIAECHILVPQSYLGPVLQLCVEKRGIQVSMNYHGGQVALVYHLPMAEVMLDFFDRLKSVSRGYASLDYQFKLFKADRLVRLDILINGEAVDALAVILHRERASSQARLLVEKIKECIPRQQFDVAIQAALGSQIIARSTVKQLRKNVLAKCYGGDISRKKKLLQKQKEGKKRMKAIGQVQIPQAAFMAALHIGTERSK